MLTLPDFKHKCHLFTIFFSIVFITCSVYGIFSRHFPIFGIFLLPQVFSSFMWELSSLHCHTGKSLPWTILIAARDPWVCLFLHLRELRQRSEGEQVEKHSLRMDNMNGPRVMHTTFMMDSMAIYSLSLLHYFAQSVPIKVNLFIDVLVKLVKLSAKAANRPSRRTLFS